MTLPEQDQTFQQIRTAQERAIGRGGTAYDDVIASACACMTAICHEFVSPQPALAGFFINGLGGVNAVFPVGGGMNV